MADITYANRVRETTTTTGTGTLDLDGAVTGYQTFVAGAGDAAVVYYTIVGQSGGAASGEWEVGIGTVTDAATDTLSRTTVLDSSNAGSAVNLSAGTKDVFLTQPAQLIDVRRSIDDPWHGTDDVEFGRDNVSTLPSGFSWVNQGSATYGERFGSGEIYEPGSTGGIRMVVKSLPAGWSEMWCKYSAIAVSAPLVSLVMRDSGSSGLVNLQTYINSGAPMFQAAKYTDPQTYNSAFGTLTISQALNSDIVARVIKNSSSSYDFKVSQGGANWLTVASSADVSAFMTPDQCGLGVHASSTSVPALVSFKWLRFL